MSGSKEYREYVVAALLHDVGKLIRRAKLCRGETARRHTEESFSFIERIESALRAAGVNVERVKEFVARHHEGDFGIAPYDRAAAYERIQGDDESGQGLAIAGRREEDIPLAIYVEDKVFYVPPCPLPDRLEEAERLTPRESLPTREEVCRCYEDSYKRLLDLAEKLKERKMSYPQLVETLVYVLRSVATFVPAAVYGVKVPDTSLYAHSIFAAALASTGGRFVLVGLDVGRIQEYMKRAGMTKGAMAILRGRSLMINLLQRVAARWLIKQINKKLNSNDVATWANVLLDTGGEVLLILPYVEGLEELLQELERRVVEDTEGVLTLYAASVGPYSLKDLRTSGEPVGQPEAEPPAASEKKGFRDLVGQLEKKIAERKMRYVDYAARADETPNAKSQHAQYSFHSDVCKFCGRPAKPIREELLDAELCGMCSREFNAGKAARDLKVLAIAEGIAPSPDRDRPNNCHAARFTFLGHVVYVIGGPLCGADSAVRMVAGLGRGLSAYLVNNPSEFIREIDDMGYGFVFTNQHMPAKNDEVKSLDAVGRYAVFLKADANEMGKRKARASERPSLLATFATTVSMSYELYPALLALKHRDGIGDIFVVYAGGDDLTLAGDLSALKYIAKVAEYAERWGFRTAVGLKIDDPYLPIYYAWTEAERRLRVAKRDRGRSLAVLVTEPVEITLDAKTLGQLYDKTDPELLEEEEVGRLTRIVYLHLFKIYRAISLHRTGRGTGLPLQTQRELAKTFIELTYVLNRREDRARDSAIRIVRQLSDIDISPSNLPRLYAKIKEGAREEVAEKLRTALIGLYLLHLRKKAKEPTE
ncbi:MAG: type III-A CRISPR-associated protein Cas10/Csm1 [Pyrobaculum sp.]|jgi:CRISPR-associated protein Csm1|nr:type III-A CRISPR-associated protein Cas10/Csm1 [Pyrobaculum sp.]